MERLSEQYSAPEERGDMVRGSRLTGHRVSLRAALSLRRPARDLAGRALRGTGAGGAGFTLIELVIPITIMTILTLGVVPLVKVSVKRQREQQLRETLRSIRGAIDQFHREALAFNCNLPAGQGQQQQQLPTDPRIKVAITDCTIYGVDNPDRYPPDLDTLVNGVNVIPVASSGGRGQQGVNATDVGNLATKKKVYLRTMPIDPITGKAEWDVRSCYDLPDSDSTGGENVFDVRSKSKDTALNGEKYSDW